MLDLGNPLDFAKATLSDVAGILQDFTGFAEKNWNIQEAAYLSDSSAKLAGTSAYIKFHIFKSSSEYGAGLSQVSDHGGRRKVKYSYPYRDGQTTDDLGRMPESFDFDIIFHGKNYMVGFNKILKEIDNPSPGTLIHPVRGVLRVVPESWQITHSSSSRQAMTIRITFIEHNFTIGTINEISAKTVKSALTTALETFAKIERAILEVEGAITFGRTLINKIKAALSTYKTNYAVLLGKMNKTFNKGSSVDIPTLLPVNLGGSSGTTGESSTFPLVTNQNDPYKDVPLDSLSSETTTAIAVIELTKEVNSLRDSVNSIVTDIAGGADGQGALDFYDVVLDLKDSAIKMQDVLEQGIQTSQARITSYTTPRDMSLREVAFLNGLEVDRVIDLDILNPELLSVNFILKGTAVKVPA